MKLNGRDVTQRRLLLIGTTTIASLGVGMMTAGQAQADTPTRSASSTAAAAVVTDPQTQQLSDAQTKASQAASTAATAKIVADQAVRADQVAQSAVASAQSHVAALSEQATVAQATSSAVSTVSAATDQATSALGQVSQSLASGQMTVAASSAPDDNGLPVADDESSTADNVQDYEQTASLLYLLYGHRIPDHDSSDNDGLSDQTVQAAIQEATTTAEQNVIPADWNVVISGAAYAQDGIVYYETDQTQYGDAVDQAAAWWNQNAGQTVFQRADASHPATAHITDYYDAHFSMLATTGADGIVGLDVSVMEAFNYEPLNVITHEMGHLLGLAHAPAVGDIMNATVPRQTYTFSDYDRAALKTAICAYGKLRDSAGGDLTKYQALSGYMPLSTDDLALLGDPNYDQWHSLRSQLRTVATQAAQLEQQSTALKNAEQQATDAANAFTTGHVTLAMVKTGVEALLALYQVMGSQSTDMFSALNVNLSAATLAKEAALREQLLQPADTTQGSTETGQQATTTTAATDLTQQLKTAQTMLTTFQKIAVAAQLGSEVAQRHYQTAQTNASVALTRYQALLAVVNQGLHNGQPQATATNTPASTTNQSTHVVVDAGKVLQTKATVNPAPSRLDQASRAATQRKTTRDVAIAAPKSAGNHSDQVKLPQTSERETSHILALVGTLLMGLMGLLGIRQRQRRK
ncbi:MAG: LPXTG cell wall anchor domain-containing protein [Lactobacillus sp.]|jgi:LPXTG-motif cell wall-anchored protein|nr:MAG: LPXTG cell wall anchor domain-containing protein [Lactobacillus sp.]